MNHTVIAISLGSTSSAVDQIRLRDRHFPLWKTDSIGYAVLNFCLKHTHVTGSLKSDASDERFLRAMFVVGSPLHVKLSHLGIDVMSFGFKNADLRRTDANIMASCVGVDCAISTDTHLSYLQDRQNGHNSMDWMGLEAWLCHEAT